MKEKEEDSLLNSGTTTNTRGRDRRRAKRIEPAIINN